MTYSKIHQRLSQILDRSSVLTHPENHLGPNYETVLHFWKYVESLDPNTRYKLLDSYCPAILDNVIGQLCDKVKERLNFESGTLLLACGCLDDFSSELVIARATYEIILMDQLLEEGYKMVFLPMFEV